MFFDIGANIGKWSLTNISNCDKIIAIEAAPNTFQKLLSNVISCDNIICLNYAVCNSNEEYVDFFNCATNTISTLNGNWLTSTESRFYNHNSYNIIKCKTIKLDSLIEKYGIPKLIKVDVEGGEFETISSLTTKVEQICFEWASETNDITFKCMDHLETLGYQKYAIQYEDEYTFRPTDYFDKETILNHLKNTTPKNEWGMIWVIS
jgi:FkbM family methyltransferase